MQGSSRPRRMDVSPSNRTASDWRCAIVETPSNGDIVLVMWDDPGNLDPRAAGLTTEILPTGGHPVVLGEWRGAGAGRTVERLELFDRVDAAGNLHRSSLADDGRRARRAHVTSWGGQLPVAIGRAGSLDHSLQEPG